MKMGIKIDKLEHGKEIPGKLGRWCDVHRVVHGRFYLCPEYSLAIKTEIRREEKSWLRASASYALVIIFTILLVLIKLR